MDELKVFANDEFGEIRTLIKDDGAWFVGVDAAALLGYSDPSKAVFNHVDKMDRRLDYMSIRYQNGNDVNRRVSLINESGLYSLILSSKLPQAKSFKHWITSEVLPSIQATGSYNIVEPTPLALPEQKAEAEAAPSALPLLQEFNKTLQLAHRLQRDCNIKADKVLRMAQNMLEGVR